MGPPPGDVATIGIRDRRETDAGMNNLVSAESSHHDIRLSWGGATDVGKVREVNEDSYLISPGLWVVADGMGGHQAGDVASKICIDTCTEAVSKVPLQVEQVSELVTEANDRVLSHAETTQQLGMGSTLVGVALIDNGGEDALLIFNVGDSRCYEMVSGGELVQLSIDHSLVQEMVDQGDLTQEQARTHPRRNVVTRAIGIGPHVSADFFVLAREGRTRLLLCSDGVSGELSNPEMAEILRSADSPAAAAESLIGAVLSSPARDNATAVVVDIDWEAVVPTTDSQEPEEVTSERPLVKVSTVGVPAISEVPRSEADDTDDETPAVAMIDEVPL